MRWTRPKHGSSSAFPTALGIELHALVTEDQFAVLVSGVREVTLCAGNENPNSTKPAEIRLFLRGALNEERTHELTEQMRAAGLPL